MAAKHEALPAGLSRPQKFQNATIVLPEKYLFTTLTLFTKMVTEYDRCDSMILLLHMDTFIFDMRLIYWRQSPAIIFVNEKFSRTNARDQRLYLQHATNVVAEQGI